ncbi:hypothetical protein [Neodiprion sertifer nucleopolyhedrovirus]|uniref:RING-type domain-containing protein n=1 Tax=Neodiprion sertifer nucleopolyhedrovirus TaxID=111874 RepID=Q6JKE2_9CBAC|nr:hypothetical protein NeseNPV_gp18 [Neodiprion sertifer nucleopolyhedrovirus]AAQ96395.1 hypothetical protein [Neodiprion sertifer nucleopolyhedrovirus]
MKRCRDASVNTDVVDDETKQQLATLRSEIIEMINKCTTLNSIIFLNTRTVQKFFEIYSLRLEVGTVVERIEYFETTWGEEIVDKCKTFMNWTSLAAKHIDMSYIKENLIKAIKNCLNSRFLMIMKNMAMQSAIKELTGSVTCDEPYNVWCSIVKLYELSKENQHSVEHDEYVKKTVLANLEKIQSCDGPEKMKLMHEIMSDIRDKVEPVDLSLLQKMVKKTNPLNPEHKEFLQNAMFPSMLKVDRECIICFEEKLIYEFCYYDCGHSVCSECSHKVNPNQCHYQCANSKLLTVGFKPANHE